MPGEWAGAGLRLRTFPREAGNREKKRDTREGEAGMNRVVGVIIFMGAGAFLVYLLSAGHVSIAWERIIIYLLVAGGISLAGRARAARQKKQDEEFFRQHPMERQQGDALWKNVDPRAAQEDVRGLNAGSGDMRGLNAGSGDMRGVNAGSGDMRGVNASSGDMRGLNAGSGDMRGLNATWGADAGAGADITPPASGVVRPGAGVRATVSVLLVFIWLTILGCTVLAAVCGAFADGDMETIGSFGALVAVAAVATFVLNWLLNNFCCELYYTPGGVTVKGSRKERHYSWREVDNYTQRANLYTFRDREGKKLFYANSAYGNFGEFFDQYLRTRGGY